jgi:hypothetical protein
MDQTDPRVAFIEARLNEAETEAKAVLANSCRSYTWWEDDLRGHAEWMLRDVQAKRRLLTEMVLVVGDLDEIAYSEGQGPRHPKRVGEYLSDPTGYLLTLLAESWSDHDDYAALFPESTR